MKIILKLKEVFEMFDSQYLIENQMKIDKNYFKTIF